MQGTRIGLGIANNVFQVPGVDAQGKVVVRKQLNRSQGLASFGIRRTLRVVTTEKLN